MNKKTEKDVVAGAVPSAVETGSRAENPSISVRATKEGFLDVFRHEGDVFFVTQEQFSDEWMEKLSKADLGEANAQDAFLRAGRTSIAAPDNPAGDAVVDAIVGGNKQAQPGVIKDVGTPVDKKAN